ncbi:hypothetical protein C3L33_10151, partial [Rhododendron williamsianum]
MAVLLTYLVLAHLLLSLAATGAAKVPAVIVFGDSSVDAGNNNVISTVLKSNFAPYGRDFYGGRATGRFSNGRVPSDFISEAFGLRPFVPAYLDPMYNISDFAVGSVIPLWKEVEYYKDYQTKLRAYLGDQKANTILTESLYLTSLGTNDFMENYYTMPGRRSRYTIDQYQDFILGLAENFVKEIYGLGARKISLGGLPPMGCLPLERATNFLGGSGDTCTETYNNVALGFNVKMTGLVAKLNEELPGAKVVFSNPYFIFLQIIRRPSFYGFDVSSVACCATGMFEMGYMCNRYTAFTCTDASKYVFWDAFHPTEKTNSIISDHLVKHVLGGF